MDAAALPAVMAQIEQSLKPYHDGFLTFRRIPVEGIDRTTILAELEKLSAAERDHWSDGHASGAVYHGDPGHVDLLNRVYALNSQSNQLHPDLFPSASKFEAEIVAMTAAMLGGADQPGICGTVTSGGTESILLAMKTYRDWARVTKGIERGRIVAPTSAHAAFDKAAQLFAMEITRVPVGDDFRADVAAMERAITDDTAVIVGSAPGFPHGVVDPIPELSELARKKGVGFHTDGCLGGFLLPWVERLGYDVPSFDFRLPGVTSISADTHKYGYAAKGTSVVLYRSQDLRRHQYFAATEWPGGLYATPTLAGSRPGGLSAACWAAMVSMGEAGYLESARRIMETAVWIREAIEKIPELRVLGKPLFLIAFASDDLNIYQVMAAMAGRGWNLNGLQRPASVHLCVTLRHTQPGVRERFATDLRDCVETVRANPQAPQGLGPIYGMAALPGMQGAVAEMLDWYLDTLYET